MRRRSSDNSAGLKLALNGEWTTDTLRERRDELSAFDWPAAGDVTADGSGLIRLDLAGAWLLMDRSRQLELRGIRLRIEGLEEEQRNVIELVMRCITCADAEPPEREEGFLVGLGRHSAEVSLELWRLLAFIGESSVCLTRLLLTP